MIFLFFFALMKGKKKGWRRSWGCEGGGCLTNMHQAGVETPGGVLVLQYVWIGQPLEIFELVLLSGGAASGRFPLCLLN